MADTIPAAQQVMIVSSIIIQAEQGARVLQILKSRSNAGYSCRIVKACTVNRLCGLRTSGALAAGTTGVVYSLETPSWPAGDNLRGTVNEATTDQ